MRDSPRGKIEVDGYVLEYVAGRGWSGDPLLCIYAEEAETTKFLPSSCQLGVGPATEILIRHVAEELGGRVLEINDCESYPDDIPEEDRDNPDLIIG